MVNVIGKSDYQVQEEAQRRAASERRKAGRDQRSFAIESPQAFSNDLTAFSQALVAPVKPTITGTNQNYVTDTAPESIPNLSLDVNKPVSSKALGSSVRGSDIQSNLDSLVSDLRDTQKRIIDSQKISPREMELSKKVNQIDQQLYNLDSDVAQKFEGSGVTQGYLDNATARARDRINRERISIASELDALVGQRKQETESGKALLEATNSNMNLLMNLQKITQPNLVNQQINKETGDIIGIVQNPDGSFSSQVLGNVGVEEAKRFSNTGIYEDATGQKIFYGLTPEGTIETQVLPGDFTQASTDQLLSVSEAEKLGVPYGTTRSQAYGSLVGGSGQLSQKDRISYNQDISKSPEVKNIEGISQLANTFNQLDTLFEENNRTLARLGGGKRPELESAHTAVLTTAKELFNLGVLNGPDLELLEKNLPVPTIGLKDKAFSSTGKKQQFEQGMTTLRNLVKDKIDANVSSLFSTYQGFDPAELPQLTQQASRYVNLLEQVGDSATKQQINELREKENLNDVQITQILNPLMPELSFSQAGEPQNAVDLIKNEEGFRPQAYQDQAGVWTIGYGTTRINGRPVQPGDTVSQQQADQLLAQDIQKHSTFKNKVSVPLTPSQESALLSFEYNLGSGIWNGSGILEAVNQGDFQKAGELMKQYTNAGGKPSRGLIARRDREAQLLIG